MTILPKKKINSKEKGDTEANYHRQQRYNQGQRHGAAIGAPNDVARYPYSTVSSNLNYSSYANGHFVSSGISEARGGWYDNRDISQNLINNRQALAAQSGSDEIHIGITAYSTNSGGGVSKRKKKREANISASIASGKTVSRNTRIEHTNIEDSNENMDQQPCGSSTAPLKTGLPSPPHQNSEDEYDTQNEISSQERELRFERQLKAKKGFLIKKMKEDGACLFRAISDQIYGDQDMHSIIRNLVCDYMMKNRDFFQQFVTEDFNRYIERKRVDSEHGNHVELQAISEMYNRPIEIYIYDSEPSNVFQSSYRTDDLPIRLSYHNNIHYNSVYDPYAASVGVGLGLPSFTPGVAEKTQMKDAIRASESLYIEQAMYEDKLRLTDWEATSEAISEAVLRESRLQFLRDQEKKQQTISQQGGSFTSITNNNTTSPRSSPGYTSSTYGNMTATSSTCGKPCCSYSTASPPLSNQREHKVGAGLLNYPSMDPAVSAESPHLSASCCFTKSCAINNIGNHQNKDQQGALSQRSSPLQPSNYQLRSMASSPKASHSPNSSGNKSPVLPIPLALQSNYNNMNGAGSNGVGTKLSPCPSPDYGAMGYLWPPNSPKVMYPNTGDFDASVGLGGVVGGVTDSQQQQPEYNLLRVLMESQLEYYNSFRSRNPARSPSQPQHSPQPGPSSTS